MFSRISLIIVALILVACGTLPPPGNYIVQPISGPITPEYTYCEYGQCWNVVFSDEVYAPPPETFPAPSPIPTSTEPTPTPIQAVYICPTGSYVNIRQLATTSSAIVGTLQSGQRILMATSLDTGWYQVVFQGSAAYIHKSVSTVCSSGTIVS